jgi:nicotinamidase/pyrazinamidase
MDRFDLVLASRDWHPADSRHFERWPVHCVRDTRGADYHPDLNTAQIHLELFKGTENTDDGYSAFEATNVNLLRVLQDKGVDELYVTGIATEYCVRATVLEARKNNIPTVVITDAVKAIEARPGDAEKALEEMARAGARLVTSKEIIGS